MEKRKPEKMTKKHFSLLVDSAWRTALEPIITEQTIKYVTHDKEYYIKVLDNAWKFVIEADTEF